MKIYEFEGKSESEALLKASEELGMNIRDMDYTVSVEEELFGMIKKYRITVRLPDDFEPGKQTVDLTPPQDQAALKAKGLLEELLSLMGYEYKQILISRIDQEVHLEIDGLMDRGITGKDTKTLGALQLILNRAINKELDDEHKVHVVIDTGNIKERHEEVLKKDAISMAKRAIKERRIIRMGPMSARDRRLVHLALKDMKGVTTRSEGEGNKRRLLIIPQSQDRSKRRGGKRRGRKGERS